MRNRERVELTSWNDFAHRLTVGEPPRAARRPRPIEGILSMRSGFIVALTAISLLGAGPAIAGGLFGKDGDDLFKQGKSIFDSFTKGDKGGASNLSVGALTNTEIGRGLKEALRVGTDRVVGLLGRLDGFNARPDIHIPLPRNLRKVQKALNDFGMGKIANDLEDRLNRAAETAVPRTVHLFRKAIEEMTWADVQRIYKGPNDAATQYFKGKMTTALANAMRPVVQDQMAKVGALRTYEDMMGEYRRLPFMPDVRGDLTEYVLGKALDGVFLYLAREEAAIRRDPAKRTTELLRRVFGQG